MTNIKPLSAFLQEVEKEDPEGFEKLGKETFEKWYWDTIEDTERLQECAFHFQKASEELPEIVIKSKSKNMMEFINFEVIPPLIGLFEKYGITDCFSDPSIISGLKFYAGFRPEHEIKGSFAKQGIINRTTMWAVFDVIPRSWLLLSSGTKAFYKVHVTWENENE